MIGLFATIENLKRKCVINGKIISTIKSCGSLIDEKKIKKNKKNIQKKNLTKNI